MMLGEVIGMGSVGAAAVLGIAAILHVRPALFGALKIAGSAYLIFLGWKAWRNATATHVVASRGPRSRLSLAGLGFATAITNPKVWALYVALLPPFVNPARPLALQLTVMLAIIVVVELMALYFYALGGRLLVRVNDKSPSPVHAGKFVGLLMAAMGAWMLVQ